MVQTHGIREDLINLQYEFGWIRSNRHGQVVFRKGWRDAEGHVTLTGEIIIDLRDPHRVYKETGKEGLYLDLDSKATKAVICSSPMEALAIRSTPQHAKSCVIAVGNTMSEQTEAALGALLEKFKVPVTLAENLTAAGRRLAGWIREHFPPIDLLPLPKGVKTWLDLCTPDRSGPDLPEVE